MGSKIITWLLVIVVVGVGNGYSQLDELSMTTRGHNSPSVIAKKAHIKYGINEPVIKKLLSFFESKKKKMGVKAIEDSVAKLIRDYLKKGNDLTCYDYHIRNTLTWINVETKGNNSPAIVAYGDVAIEYGISYEMFKVIIKKLLAYEKNDMVIREKLEEMSRHIEELTKALEPHEGPAKAAAIILNAIKQGQTGFGNSPAVVESGFDRSSYSTAFYGYVLGLLHELSFKYDRSMAYFRSAAFNDTTNSAYQLAYAESLRKTGAYDACIPLYEKVKELGFGLKRVVYDTLFYAYAGAGKAYQKKGMFDKALRNFDSARWCMQYCKPNTQSYFIDAVTNYCIELGQFREARVEAQKLLSLLNKGAGPRLLPSANYCITLGLLYHIIGKYDSSLNFFRLGLPKRNKQADLYKPLTAEAFSGIASNYLAMGKFDSVIYLFDASRQINTPIFGMQSVAVASDYINKGVAYMRIGDAVASRNQAQAMVYYDSAEVNYRKAWKIDSLIFKDGKHPELAIILGNLGERYTKKMDFPQAVSCHQQALDIYLNYYKNEHPLVALALNNLGGARLEWFKYVFWDTVRKQHTDSLDICLDLLKRSGNMSLMFYDSTHDNLKVVFNNIAAALVYKANTIELPYGADSAMHVYRVGIAYALAGTDTTIALLCYGIGGRIFKDSKRWDSALIYLKKGANLITPRDPQANADSISNILLELKDGMRASTLAFNYYNIGKCLSGSGDPAGEREILKGLKDYALKRKDPDILELLRKEGLIN